MNKNAFLEGMRKQAFAFEIGIILFLERLVFVLFINIFQYHITC